MKKSGCGPKMIINIRRHHRNHDHKELSPYLMKQFKWIETIKENVLDPKLYKINFKIYESGSIRICHGEHMSSKHQVVIKMIDLDDEERLDTIIHEVRTLNKLRHNNVLPLLSSIIADRRYLWNILVQAEYGSADQWSKPNGLPEMAIAFIIKDVLTALSYLHKRGIIHRAVCGSHILINSNGNCMLTGLKYSTTVIQKGRWQPVIHDYPKNSPQILNHLAPEILEQNLLGYNSKSDIYSVGIVCCELANGCVPFEDVILIEMLLDKLTGNYPRPMDSTCEEIKNFPVDDPDITPDVKEKYNVYRNRIFSASFHTFTVEKCLNFDSSSRPMASELLDDSFLKQTKKSNGLIKILQQLTSRPSNVIVNIGGGNTSDDYHQNNVQEKKFNSSVITDDNSQEKFGSEQPPPPPPPPQPDTEWIF